MTGASTSGTVIRGNLIGTNAAGDAPLGNGYVGIWLDAGGGTVVGGGMSGARNVISGNLNDGIYGYSPNFRIQGNLIGLNKAGTAALLNAGGGAVQVGSANSVIGVDGDGVDDAGEGNVIAHGLDAVSIGNTDVSGMVFAGNIIGLNAAGTAKAAGGGGGVLVYGTSTGAVRFGTNADGVSDASERNLFATGLRLIGGSGHVIAGNYFGTDATGLVGLGDGYISIEASGVRVGTNADGVRDDAERNVVADLGDGVIIYGSNNTVAGNYIGLGADGTTSLPNRGGPLYGGVSILGGLPARAAAPATSLAAPQRRPATSSAGTPGPASPSGTTGRPAMSSRATTSGPTRLALWPGRTRSGC